MKLSLTEKQLGNFWRKVTKTETCWLWTGGLSYDGYSTMLLGVDRKPVRGHRLAFFLEHGELDDAAILDHKCRVRNCVNPSHLRIATGKQNQENRGVQRNNTSGVRGVSWDKQYKKWRAYVHYDGRVHQLGRYATVEEAAGVARAKRNEVYTHNEADRAGEVA